MLAALRIETLRGVPVGRLSGEVDASNASELSQQLTAAVPNTALGMVLDLTETSYLDSSGVQLLFELADRLRRRQQRLLLVVPQGSFIGDVLNAVSMGGLASIVATLSEAVDELSSQDSAPGTR
jgi:anti-sigma B factor antagonist